MPCSVSVRKCRRQVLIYETEVLSIFIKFRVKCSLRQSRSTNKKQTERNKAIPCSEIRFRIICGIARWEDAGPTGIRTSSIFSSALTIDHWQTIRNCWEIVQLENLNILSKKSFHLLNWRMSQTYKCVWRAAKIMHAFVLIFHLFSSSYGE